MKEVLASEDWGRRFKDRFKWKIVNRKSISFWDDIWASCGNLKSVYPRLCSLSVPSEPMLVEVGNWLDGVWEWKLVWRRNMFEWEKALESQLLQELQGMRLEFDWRIVGSGKTVSFLLTRSILLMLS